MKLKVISDQDCEIYVDGALVTVAPALELTMVSLDKGEYIIRYVCKSFPALSIEKDVLLEYDKIERLDFQAMLSSNKRLAAESQLEPCEREEDGKYGYVVKGTTLWVIPPSYENAEQFRGIGSMICAIVYKKGTVGAIRKDGSYIVPLGQYRTLDLLSDNSFKGKDLDGEEWRLSSEGSRICNLDMEFEQLRDLIVLPDAWNPGKNCACFLDGTSILELGSFNRCVHAVYTSNTYRLHTENFFLPYYIVERDDNFYESVGIFMINNRNHSTICIHPVNMRHLGSLQFLDTPLDDDKCVVHEFYCFEDRKAYKFELYPFLGMMVRKQSVQPYTENEEYDYDYNVEVYNGEGKVVFSRDNISFGGFEGGDALFTDCGRQYILSAKGKISGPFGPYEFHTGFFMGYAEIVKEGKHGLINRHGEIVIPCEYDALDWEDRYYLHTHYMLGTLPDFSLLVWLKVDGKVGVFDLEKGRILIEPVYEELEMEETQIRCSKVGGWDVYNYSGELIST